MRYKRLFNLANLFYLLFLLVQLLPDTTKKTGEGLFAIYAVTAAEIILLVLTFTMKKTERFTTIQDVYSIVFGFMVLWTILTAKLNVIPEDIFKAPGVVIKQFIEDFPRLLTDLGSSISIVFMGYILALVTAIPIGLLLAWNVRLGKAFSHVANFLGSIPPVVFIPYTLALLPTFKSCSVFVIFITAFWPILSGTMSGVLNVEEKIVNSARVLNLSPISILFQVMLPASLPQIFDSCNIALSLSFILLTSAEMIGGGSGIGFYIQYYANFGNFTRIMVGIIFLGIVVTVVTAILQKIEKKLLVWKK